MEPVKSLKIDNLGTKGINTDIEPWSLSSDYITEGRNFRIFANAIKANGGSSDWSQAPLHNPGLITPVPAPTGDYWLTAGRTAVYVYDGFIWSDISSTAGYANISTDDELLWTSCRLGKIPIVNNPKVYPEYWNDQRIDQILQPLQFDALNTWSDMGYTFKVIRSHNNFLFALNLTEGINEIPTGYRWSHPADINGLPFTWDETDLSGIAGRAQIGGDHGPIIDGHSLRESFCIYSESGISMLDFVGGEFVWKRRELTSTVGLIVKNCIAEVKGSHIFLGDGDILVNNGTTITSILHNRLRKRFTSNLSAEFFDRSFIARYDALKEIWFCIPEGQSIYPNIAYIYNWRDDSWALKDLPENLASAGYGKRSEPAEQWDDATVQWNAKNISWGANKLTPLNNTVVGVNNVTSKLIILDAFTDIIHDDVNFRIERTNFPLEGFRNVTTITRVYPHIEGNQPVNIQFGSQEYPGGSVKWKPAVVFTPSVDRKVDIRTTGELHAWRISSIGNGALSISGMTIEYTVNGLR